MRSFSGWWSECFPDAAHSERPLADVARVAVGSFGAALVAVGALISFYGYLSAKILGMPRVTFALAEQGDFPQAFAAVHPAISHALRFDSGIRGAGVGFCSERRIQVECNALRGRAPALLRGVLCRAAGAPAQAAGRCRIPLARR